MLKECARNSTTFEPTSPTPSDIVYLRGVAKYLNAMLAARAAAANATYVDTATSGIGHDFCSVDRWVEGLVPLNPAAPVHPTPPAWPTPARWWLESSGRSCPANARLPSRPASGP